MSVMGHRSEHAFQQSPIDPRFEVCIVVNCKPRAFRRRLDPTEPRAHARSTDPATSHSAARSISSEAIRRSQEEVLEVMRMWTGGFYDEQLVATMRARGTKQSVSGIRTRRAELRDKGLVYDTGKRERLQSGRMSIVWAARP